MSLEPDTVCIHTLDGASLRSSPPNVDTPAAFENITIAAFVEWTTVVVVNLTVPLITSIWFLVEPS